MMEGSARFEEWYKCLSNFMKWFSRNFIKWQTNKKADKSSKHAFKHLYAYVQTWHSLLPALLSCVSAALYMAAKTTHCRTPLYMCLHLQKSTYHFIVWLFFGQQRAPAISIWERVLVFKGQRSITLL